MVPEWLPTALRLRPKKLVTEIKACTGRTSSRVVLLAADIFLQGGAAACLMIAALSQNVQKATFLPTKASKHRALQAAISFDCYFV